MSAPGDSVEKSNEPSSSSGAPAWRSVFSSLSSYFRMVLDGLRSVTGSLGTALPYLLRFNAGDLRKEVTEQYPDPISSRTADDLPSRSRGLLVNAIEKCTGCGDCSVVCPVNCITVETESAPDARKTWVAVFDIDVSRCLFCGLCVEVCPPQSLTHSRVFEAAASATDSLVRSFGRGHITHEEKLKWVDQLRISRDREYSL